MKDIMKCLTPTNVSKVRVFIGETQYMRKRKASFSIVATSLHVITTTGNGFQWEKGQQKSFKELKAFEY